jgi:hypothetical protein
MENKQTVTRIILITGLERFNRVYCSLLVREALMSVESDRHLSIGEV